MTYSFPIDTDRIAAVLEANITAKGRNMAGYLTATDDLKAGVFTAMTMQGVKSCGRKAAAAVKKDLFFQSMEAQRNNA